MKDKIYDIIAESSVTRKLSNKDCSIVLYYFNDNTLLN